ncbi:prolipoprotein diacylglyceryl transferase [uncultured Clostridium sp.]|uniref:prolipoprotein diacylglyceryl transferase n=1 Tax=uncultured Clostridium sp. TaxID=59620 RepID=UPI0028EA6440|nr:prolipoprotein diacylglyceryl transferase [uncultured Clostridium sp.]
MNPIAFTIFGLPIMWYGILISLGMLLALLLSSYTCKMKNLNFDILFDTFLISFPMAIIGARLYYVIFSFEDYADNLWSIFNTRGGGLAIHGGLIFGLTTAFFYLRKKKQNFLEYADVSVPGIILAQAIGRWGNFFNKEAHGGEVTLEFISKFPEFIQRGMYIKGTYYHPTFLYESIWNVLVCVTLIILLKRSKQPGTVLFAYIGLYSLGRFFIEGLRTDSLMFGPIRMAQFVSLLGILASIVFLVYIYKRKKSL